MQAVHANPSSTTVTALIYVSIWLLYFPQGLPVILLLLADPEVTQRNVRGHRWFSSGEQITVFLLCGTNTTTTLE